MDFPTLGLTLIILLVSLAAVYVEHKDRSPFYYVALVTAVLAVTALGIHIASSLSTMLVLGTPLEWSKP